ncbi:MAG: vWA domain-containing protein [Candidatus Micrarchaeaceae archaeon]
MKFGAESFPPPSTERRVTGEEEENTKIGEGEEKGGNEQSKKPLSPEELAEYTARAKKFLDGYRNFLTTFSGDVSLKFQLSDKFAIDLENGVVHSDGRWYAEQGYTETQILWAHLHELMHFRDLADDPEGMKENREYIFDQARKTGDLILKKWEEAVGATNPEYIDKLRRTRPIAPKSKQVLNGPQMAAVRYHHTFFNVIDDIYVNKGVERRAPRFEPRREGGQEIAQLYREKLFAQKDYANQPRHLQFLYSLLRDEMVKDEESESGEEVAAFLVSKSITFRGKTYTPRELIDTFIKPRSGRDTKPSTRYGIYRQTLEPIFLDLLHKDIEDWEPKLPPQQPPQEGQGGQSENTEPSDSEGKKPDSSQSEAGDEESSEAPEDGGQGGEANDSKDESGSESNESGSDPADPFGGEYDEFEKTSPDQLDEGDMQDWAEDQAEEKKKEQEVEEQRKREERKRPEEKARESQAEMDAEWCKEHNVNPRAMAEYRRLEEEVAPYLKSLSQLWQKIAYGKSTLRERGMAGNFRTGVDLNLPSAIDQWPAIESGNYENTRIMKRTVAVEKIVEKPELLRVRLVGDDSGSMDDFEKREALKKAIVLIESSLREFNTILNYERPRTKSKLRAESEIWKFGNDAEKVKSLRQGNDFSGELRETIESLHKFEARMGGTDDASVLRDIKQSLSETDWQNIHNKKTMELVIEVTDGGSSVPDATKQEIQELSAGGVIVRALQIGRVDPEERRIFTHVWIEDREPSFGSIIGANMENLLPAIVTILQSYLKDVEL